MDGRGRLIENNGTNRVGVDYRSLFAAIPGLHVVVLPDDPTFTIVAVTEAYAKATLTQPNEIIGRALFDVFPENPQDSDGTGARNVHASLRRVLATKSPDTMAVQRYDIRRPDGSFEERYWSPVNSPVLGTDGSVTHIIQSVEDVTARKKTNDALVRVTAHSEQQGRFYDAILSSTPDLAYLFDLQHRFSYANKALLTMWGKSWEEAIGKNCLELGYEPWHAAMHDREIEQVIATKQPLRGEVPFSGTHGRRIYEYIFVPVVGADGEVEAVAGTTRDVTERKRAEVQQEFLLTLSDAIRSLHDPEEIKRAASRVLGERLKANRTFYAEVEDDNWVVEGGYAEGVAPLPPGRYAAETYGRSIMETFRAGERKVINDARSHLGLSPEEREALVAIKIFAAAGVPLVKDGKLVAILTVQSAEPRNWTQDDLSLVEATADRTWSAVERARAEAALRHSEERLTFALEAGGGVGTFDWDVPGDHLYIDARFAQLFSVDPQYAAAGAPLAAFVSAIHPDDRPMVSEKVQQACKTGDYAAEYRIVQPDGAVCWVFARGRCHQDAAGNPTRFLGVIVDITGRKVSEAERERLLQQIQAERHRLEQVFAEAPVGVCVVRGRDFVYELANTSYQDNILPGRTLVGRRLLDVVPEVDPAIIEILNRILDTGEPFVANERLLPLDKDSDGVTEDGWYDLLYHPLREPDGTVSGIVSVVVEVTEQVLARRELERVNKELEEFAYVASHDLQEPLRMVNIYTQLLVRDFCSKDAKAENYAEFIHKGVTRMEKLIRDLLTYSRSLQKDELPIGKADLSAALSDAMSVLKTRIEESDALIAVEALPVGSGDTAQMSHVFQNLLSNALKYRKRDARPEIHISAKVDRQQCIVCVQDNGIGFEQKYAERIFGLFKRLHKEEYPGTGLGLAICQRIVERYGGRAWAEGTLGKGSRFYFSLPYPAEE